MAMSEPVHAAILAAGLSSRFGGTQKALHRLGDATLLERTLRHLRGAGLASVTVVTGHGNDAVERALGSEIATLHNARYAEWNNFHSVELACEQLPPGDVLVVNGDVVFARAALDAVLAPAHADFYLGVSDGEVDDEAMKAEVAGQRVVALGKSIPAERAAGEFIGISRLTPDARAWYRTLARWGSDRGLTGQYYEDVYDGLCRNLVGLRCEVDDADWAEIDDVADLERAQAVAARVDAPDSSAPTRSEAPPA
jgi:choline kinase